MKGSELSVFVLAPVLLLMSQDQYLPALHSSRRYFVVGVAISSYLAASSLWQASQSPAIQGTSSASSLIAANPQACCPTKQTGEVFDTPKYTFPAGVGVMELPTESDQ